MKYSFFWTTCIYFTISLCGSDSL